MFTAKKIKLFEVVKKTSGVPKNKFVQAGLMNSAETKSGNGAKKYITTGNPFVDQFGLTGQYKKPRAFDVIAADCEKLWALNKLLCVKFIFFLRTIVRVTDYINIGGSSNKTKGSQKGSQLKHEAIMRMIWLSQKSIHTFKKNLTFMVALGSWKDIITMLQYDLVYNGWQDRVLPWEFIGNFILSGLNSKSQCELVKKYLPQLRANSKCTTVEAQADNIIAKWLCNIIYGQKQTETAKVFNYKQYRQLKVSGTAHQWQQLISRQEFEKIDFDKVHGRALNLMVKSKFLANQGLSDKYKKFVTNPETTTLKFTGFVHEVMQLIIPYLGSSYAIRNTLSNVPVEVQETANKQFMGLIEKGGSSEQSNLIVVRDTSGSMSSKCPGVNDMSCYDVAKSLALYFSYFLKGEFEGTWIEFNDRAKMHNWLGDTPCERWANDISQYVGSTNFQSVIDLLCRIKHQGISEEDFPTGILCISDGEFNSGNLPNATNYQEAIAKLRANGFSEEYVSNFTMVFWNLQNNYYGQGNSGNKFETYGNVPNVYYFSGYEPSIISFLTSKIKNAEELFLEAMNQEILNLIEL